MYLKPYSWRGKQEVQECHLTVLMASLPQLIRCGVVNSRAEIQTVVNPSPFQIFLSILTKHIALIALGGISCMWQKFHTLLILALHWNPRIMHLWLQINLFGCVTEKRKPIILGASLELLP